MTEIINALRDFAILVLPLLGLVAVFYAMLLSRQLTITSKKVDYLVEDLTYKSEMLNSTVETVVKLSNYVDAFEAITKRNAKAMFRLASRNKDVFYKFADKIRDFSDSEE